jgi:signal transduction histidine kinase
VTDPYYHGYFVYSRLFIVVTSLPLALFVLWKNPKDPLHRSFSLFGLAVAGWAGMMFGALQVADSRTALILARGGNLFALFLYLFFYRFVHLLLELPHRRFLITAYGLTIGAALLSLLFPELWIDRMNEGPNGIRYIHGGWLYLIHPALGVLLPGSALFHTIRRYRRSAGEWRKKCFFMILATGIGYFGGFTTYLAVLNIPILPWGVPLVALYPLFLSYAIVRYRLIDIQTVVHKTLLWSVLSSLVWIPLYGVLWLTRFWLEGLPTWGVSLFALGVFYLTMLYYKTIQPRIDHLFQRRKYDLQRVLDRLLERMAVLGDRGALSEQIAETLTQTLYAGHVVFWFSNTQGELYSPGGETPPGTPGLPADDPFIEWVRRHPGVVESGSVENVPAYAEVREAARSYFARTGGAVCVPLSTGYEFVGLIDLGAKTNLKPYNELDLQLLEKLRVEAAIALSNASLYDRVMRLNGALTELNAQLEEKVQARTSDLEAANAQLSESNQRIAEADRMKTRFLANMSHELRTPLNSIIGFSKVMLKGIDGPLTPKQREDLEAIHHSGSHLLGLISDLLDLSKIEAGKMELNVTLVGLGELTRGVMSTAAALVKEKGVELRVEIDPDLPGVKGDAMRLRQVVLNLVSNAIKFTERGEVAVCAERRGAYVVVSVRDTGCGIRPEDQGGLFQEFRQLGGGPKGGSGLGLVISKRLIQLHGGEIWVESLLGEGSTFAFSLPLAKEIGATNPVVER